MGWTTPTDWAVQAVSDVSFNEQIRDNMRVLHQGGGQSAIAEIQIASDGSLAINDTDSAFLVLPHSTGLKTISHGSRPMGCEITLIMNNSAGCTIKSNESAGSGYTAIKAFSTTLSAVFNPSWYQYQRVVFTLTPSGWLCSI